MQPAEADAGRVIRREAADKFRVGCVEGCGRPALCGKVQNETLKKYLICDFNQNKL